jgi:hypothetical protein
MAGAIAHSEESAWRVMCGRFAHFGGVPMQILYDNTKIAVAPSSAGARSSETKARAADYLEMGFGPYGSLRRRGGLSAGPAQTPGLNDSSSVADELPT